MTIREWPGRGLLAAACRAPDNTAPGTSLLRGTPELSPARHPRGSGPLLRVDIVVGFVGRPGVFIIETTARSEASESGGGWVRLCEGIPPGKVEVPSVNGVWRDISPSVIAIIKHLAAQRLAKKRAGVVRRRSSPKG